MSPRVLIGSMIGLAGSLAVGWGIRYLVTFAPCGGDGAPPCPAEATPYAIALAVGLPAAIIGGLIGRRFTTFMLFPAIGVGALVGATDVTGSSRAFPLILGLSFLAVGLLPLVLIWRGRQRARLAARLLAEGRPAIATVTDVYDTGVTVNKNPRVRMTLHIVPESGLAPFEGQKIAVVSRVDLPRRGQRYPAWYDPADPSTFMLVTKVDDSAPPQVRALYAKATAAGPPAGADGHTPAVAAPADPLDRLAKLNELRLAGALTEEEFATEKAKLLGH